MKPLFYYAILSLLLVTSCSRRAYVASDFEERTFKDQLIAVLPYNVEYTGRLPKDLTEADLAEQRHLEALAFQQDLITRIGHRATRKRELRVNIQAASTTNAHLADAGITLADAQFVPAGELADILGVDALMIAEVRKHRQLSRLESFAASAVSILVNNPITTAGNSALNRTYEVDMSVQVVDTDASLLYSDSDSFGLNYSTSVNDAVERVNSRLIRRLPYIVRR